MRSSRTQKELFIASTAVVTAEVIKLVTCLGIIRFEEGSWSRTVGTTHKTVFVNFWDTLKVAIPSFVYTIQNNLLYVGATHLDAATCQVTYQLKILTTALFSIALLRKKISAVQWVSLLMLFVGVALVQLAQLDKPSINSAGREQNPWLGFMAIFMACALSGFAGVYFEKILKGADISVWMRNVQLSVVAIPIGLLTTFSYDLAEVTAKGFFHGYNAIVWSVILLQALGGLLVAMVVRYSDNILKGFSTSLAIILSCIVSIYAFGFVLTVNFCVGTLFVISSVFLYSSKIQIKS
ncbi:UDP-galactose translocator-like isoform X2 [Varroa jacobsoni]|nr:UDP-galactose translocator-like isoform X2 [Varroa destructor]XP_022648162.1 UDP-galactose translocator-like isoform X2 [Varroa destructor]XP_022648163.1 UDP-galactose translocator-like isoform X2 [Varroa destructor]XP_022687035.1 UDP-galactose translocator-like isoform X2 [Varroa jacobsoni]